MRQIDGIYSQSGTHHTQRPPPGGICWVRPGVRVDACVILPDYFSNITPVVMFGAKGIQRRALTSVAALCARVGQSSGITADLLIWHCRARPSVSVVLWSASFTHLVFRKLWVLILFSPQSAFGGFTQRFSPSSAAGNPTADSSTADFILVHVLVSSLTA